MNIRMLSLADGFRVDSIEYEIMVNTIDLYNKNAKNKLNVMIDTIANFEILMEMMTKVKFSERDFVFAMSSITRTKERSRVYDFSSIYIPSKEVIVSRSNTSYTQINNIVGHKISFQVNSIEEINIKRLAKRYKFIPVPFELYSEKGTALKNGIVDFSIEDNIAVWDNPSFKIIHELEHQSGDGIAILYPKGSKLRVMLDKYLIYYLNSTSFNKLIATKYDKAIAKYFKMNLMKINRSK